MRSAARCPCTEHVLISAIIGPENRIWALSFVSLNSFASVARVRVRVVFAAGRAPGRVDLWERVGLGMELRGGALQPAHVVVKIGWWLVNVRLRSHGRVGSSRGNGENRERQRKG